MRVFRITAGNDPVEFEKVVEDAVTGESASAIIARLLVKLSETHRLSDADLQEILGDYGWWRE